MTQSIDYEEVDTFGIDLNEQHQTDDPSCWCQPSLERYLNASGEEVTIVIHNGEQA